jgi:hypothetical protein
MPLRKRTLRQEMQDANRAALDVPMPPEPGMDLHDPDPSSGQVFQYGAKKDPAEDLVRFDWPQHAPQGSQDATPTQVFTDQEVETGKLAPPVRRRLTDKEARAQALNAEKGGLRARAQEPDAFANAKPVEQLAQEDAARILGRQPMAPPVTGEMADAPITPTVDRRGANMGRAAGERRAASGNMVSATPSNADIGQDLGEIKSNNAPLFDQGREAAQYARDAYQSTEPAAPTLREQATGAMQRSSVRNQEAAMLGERVNPQPPTVRAPRAASATSVTTPPPVENSVGTAMSATESAMSATAQAAGRQLGNIYGAARAGAYGEAALGTLGAGKSVAGALLGPLAKPAISAARGIAARNTATKAALDAAESSPFLRRMASKVWSRGGQVAGNTVEGLGGALGTGWELGKMGLQGAGYAYIGRKGAESTEARQNVAPAFREALADQQRNAAKYGMDVSSVRSNSSDALLQFKALVGADPKINVTENPTLKAQFEAENRKRIRHLIATGAITPVAHGRPTIKGNSSE